MELKLPKYRLLSPSSSKPLSRINVFWTHQWPHQWFKFFKKVADLVAVQKGQAHRSTVKETRSKSSKVPFAAYNFSLSSKRKQTFSCHTSNQELPYMCSRTVLGDLKYLHSKEIPFRLRRRLEQRFCKACHIILFAVAMLVLLNENRSCRLLVCRGR